MVTFLKLKPPEETLMYKTPRPLAPLAFDARGHLSAGIHNCTLDQLRPLVFTNPHRRAMWYRLVSFLVWPVLVPRFSHAYIGGGFLSTVSHPEDVDIILETKDPYGPEAFATVERFFLVGLENIRDIYSVDLHFWMEGAPGGLADFRAFFQYERPAKTSSEIYGACNGLVRLDLNAIAIKSQIKKHLSPLALEAA
jgi:hypothetical protein